MIRKTGISPILLATIGIVSIACGTVDDSDNSQVKSSAYACSYSVNGKNVSGTSKQECDSLKKEYGFPSMSNTMAFPSMNSGFSKPPANSGKQKQSCSYSRNGVTKRGSTKAKCDRLARQFGN